MAEAYGVFASYLKFKEVLSDPLGHLYRAGEFDATGIKRIAWLRVFDRPLIDPADLSGDFDSSVQTFTSQPRFGAQLLAPLPEVPR